MATPAATPGTSILRGIRRRERTPQRRLSLNTTLQKLQDQQKIDLCRFDSVLRYLDAPDPTGERFGIKADGRWTDIGDKEMERAIRGPVLNFMQPPQEEPPVEYESLLLPPERPKKTRSRESSRRRRRRRAEEAENQSPPGGNNGEDPIEEYRQHRKRKGGRCECCYKHSIFADSPPKMPKGVPLCPVFRAAHHSVMREKAARDVDEKRTKYELKLSSSSNSSSNSSSTSSANSSFSDSQESVSPPKGREV